MGFGSFVFVLHSHLPYYRKAGMWPFGEENLYECMAETYLPLLKGLGELLDEGIQPKVTLGITPILAEQLADKHLQAGFIQYLQTRLAAAQKDVARYPNATTPHSQHLAYLARFYVDYYQTLLDDFTQRYECDLLAGFRSLQDAGALEVLTSMATHAFSPLLGTDESLMAQLKAGVETTRKYFGRAPKGMWLPECAYRPAKEMRDSQTGHMVLRPPVEAFMYENGIEYFFTEYHAIEGGVTTGIRKAIGLYGQVQYIPMPARPATGLSTFEPFWLKEYPVAVMGRNDRASFQVWSAAHGYPGDGLYREFHKKDDTSGLHYWRLTSKACDLGNKMLYDPDLAFKKTAENADHFVSLVYHMLKDRAEGLAQLGARRQPSDDHNLCMVSFDTELFGHWWFEGVEWIKNVYRRLHQSQGLALQTAGEYLQAHPPKAAIALPESTWGSGGHYWVWNNEHTDWMWPVIHAAEHRMQALVAEHGQHEAQDPRMLRALNQALRELLLLQSSDWPFLVTTFQAKDYAIERFNTHQQRFWTLAKMLDAGHIDEAVLAEMEDIDNAFDHLDFRWFQPLSDAPRQTDAALAATVSQS
jgi:1,4-alpha-glucan branching enzyme